jgi:hypothetical protein
MRHTECHELLALPLPAPHNTAVVQGMLNNQRNDLQYDKDKRVSRFIANRSSRLLACLCGRQILAARDSMLRMSAFATGQDFDARWSSISFVVVAHALLHLL